LSSLLEDTPYLVVPCQKPSQAIERLLRDDVVLVVSDMTMPEMSGLELLRKIRSLDAEMPVVLLSGYSDPAHIAQAWEWGANEYLVKPEDIPKFRQVVERLARPANASRVSGTMRIDNGG
jgi:DNA-binding NtrC family response regulator